MSLLASKLAYHSSMDTGRRQVSQVRDEGQFHTATKARASAFSLQFPEPHFLQSDVRGLDNIFKSMHYVVGEEPPHKEFGSFIMDSKYLCSLSLFFFFLEGNYLYYVELTALPNIFLMFLLCQKHYVKWQGRNYWHLLFQILGLLHSSTTDTLLSSQGCRVCILWVIQE